MLYKENTVDNKKFGAWLKSMRQEKGLTQEELAKQVGLKHSQEIAAVESGTAPFPTKNISKLAKVFETDKEKIFQMHLKTKEHDLRKKMVEG